ncbi:MAG: aldehyde dehydrogenase (NADP(+)), partial [Phycicoccus sp.]
YLQSSGQLCTKPGVLVVPAGSGAVDVSATAVAGAPSAPMLTADIERRYLRSVEHLAGRAVVTAVVAPESTSGSEPGTDIAPSLFVARAGDVLDDPGIVTEERFGPAAVIVEYTSAEEMEAVARVIDGSLTVTVHADPDDRAGVEALLPLLRERAGRLVYNGYPTGVAVSPAMQHGGPYPSSTSSSHTAVGAAALRRFLRPVSYQNFPAELVPPELRADPSGAAARTE